MARRNRRLDQFVSWIGNKRRTGIGNQRQSLLGSQPFQNNRAHLGGIMLVIGQNRRGDAVMGQQHLGHALVLGQNGIGRRQR